MPIYSLQPEPASLPLRRRGTDPAPEEDPESASRKAQPAQSWPAGRIPQYTTSQRPSGGQGAGSATGVSDMVQRGVVHPQVVNLPQRQSQPLPLFLTPRQTPAEAYAQMRGSTASAPANAADCLEGRLPPGHADGGGVQAGKPCIVGERGPEIVVPNKSGTVVPNHALNASSADSWQILHPEWQRPVAVPPMDTLASAAPQKRVEASGRDPAAKEWMDHWQEKDVDRAEKERPAGHVQIERDLGLPSVRHMLKGKPTGLADELGTGLAEGATRVGQLAASVGSYLPGQVGRDYEARRKVYAERAEIMKKYRERDKAAQESFHSLTPGSVAAMGVSAIPEIYNPVNKAGWGAKAINAAWHGARGYLPNKSAHDSVVSALSSVAGENAEDLVRKGKMVAGNVAGTVTENALHAVLPDDKAPPPPPLVPGPIPRPVYGSGPNPMPMPGMGIKPTQAPAPEKKKVERKLNGYEIDQMKRKTPPSLRPMPKFD